MFFTRRPILSAEPGGLDEVKKYMNTGAGCSMHDYRKPRVKF